MAEADRSNDDENSGHDSGASDDEEAAGTSTDNPSLGLPAILDGRFFTVSKKIDDNKYLAKCQLCPNKLISGQMNATSNLLKHLKVSLGYL